MRRQCTLGRDRRAELLDHPTNLLMLRASRRLLLILCGSTLACRPAVVPGSQPSPSDRFPRPEEFTIVIDSTQWPHAADKIRPRYPDGARKRGVQARVIAAFIIDTTGAAEFPSITLLTSANSEFDQSVCTYLRRARFTWRAAPARRALVVWPIEFGLGGYPSLPPAPDLVELTRMFDALPRAELVARLTAERHCP